MGVTENKALASRVLDEIFHQGNLSLLDEIFAPDSAGSSGQRRSSSRVSPGCVWPSRTCTTRSRI